MTDTEWTEYCWEFTADSTVYDALRVVKIQFLETGTYYIDGAALQPLAALNRAHFPSTTRHHLSPMLSLGSQDMAAFQRKVRISPSGGAVSRDVRQSVHIAGEVGRQAS